MFDNHTNIHLDWRAPITSLSLSRVSDEAIGIALTCINSWGRGMREMAEPGDMRLVVRDEVWRQMRLGPEAVKSFDADLRLSRKDGDIQVAVAHKPSDWLSVGDSTSQAVAIAKDMLHLADTKILCGQDAEVAAELNQLLDLGPIGQNLVTGPFPVWWRVGHIPWVPELGRNQRWDRHGGASRPSTRRLR
jgi:hypothetical protein